MEARSFTDLAEVKEPCPGLSPLYKPGEECCEDHCSHDYHQEWRCKTCNGGWVFVFPDESKVRVPCNGDTYHVCPFQMHGVETARHMYSVCAGCQGRGWTASQDLATWLDAVKNIPDYTPALANPSGDMWFSLHITAGFGRIEVNSSWGNPSLYEFDYEETFDSSMEAVRAALTAALNQREGIRWPE